MNEMSLLNMHSKCKRAIIYEPGVHNAVPAKGVEIVRSIAYEILKESKAINI